MLSYSQAQALDLGARVKPTREACDIIRACALLAGRMAEPATKDVKVRTVVRCNRKHAGVGESINAVLVTRDPEGWADTDVADVTDWERFTKGVQLTADGRAIVDFAIYDRFSRDPTLLCHIIVFFEFGSLTKVTMDGAGGKILWTF